MLPKKMQTPEAIANPINGAFSCRGRDCLEAYCIQELQCRYVLTALVSAGPPRAQQTIEEAMHSDICQPQYFTEARDGPTLRPEGHGRCNNATVGSQLEYHEHGMCLHVQVGAAE